MDITFSNPVTERKLKWQAAIARLMGDKFYQQIAEFYLQENHADQTYTFWWKTWDKNKFGGPLRISPMGEFNEDDLNALRVIYKMSQCL